MISISELSEDMNMSEETLEELSNNRDAAHEPIEDVRNDGKQTDE